MLKAGLLQPICSPHNTPILAVKKGPHSWRLVQDLHKINEAIIPVHPVVTNPYSLLSFSPPDILYFTDLDLKEAFFTIPLHHSSQPLFAFTWTDPDTYQSQLLTFLPQGFRDSPHFFRQALQRDLQTLDLGSTTLLQYVDDFLLCSSSRRNCLVHTITVLNALGNWGYRVSLSKAQIASNTQLHGIASQSHIQKNYSSETSNPDTDPQAPNQKGASFSTRSIKLLPNMGPKFCPPCKTSLPSYSRKLRWTLLAPTSLHTPIQTLIKHLLQGPSLYLPDYTKPFFLFVHSQWGHALGILCQKQGDIWGPLAYLSEQLYLVMLRWSPSLQALAATTS